MSFTTFAQLEERVPAQPQYGCTPSASSSLSSFESELAEEELLAVRCDNVFLLAPFGDGSGGGGGILGSLYATNFRLAFRPAAPQSPLPRRLARFRFLSDDYDVPLAGIRSLSVTTVAEPRHRPLAGPLSALEHVCDLRLAATDFRVFLFSFKASQFAGQLANHLAHFVRPPRLGSLLNCRLRGTAPATTLPFTFNTSAGWDAELQRTMGRPEGRMPKLSWRLCHLNKAYAVVKSFPEVVVVPVGLKDDEIRLSYSWTEYEAVEERWLAKVESTAWLSITRRLIGLVALVVAAIDNGLSVVLIEPDGGRDTAAAVSSLAQLCLDRESRSSILAFQRLLAKEWSGLAHPFGERLFGLSSTGRDGELSPVFLLFLCGVKELLGRFPSAFAFSAHYLIGLWDLGLAGVTRELVANCPAEWPTLPHHQSCWSTELYFTPEYARLFNNPLFELCKNAEMRTSEVLRPQMQETELRLWPELFLRWTFPAQIMNGGEIQEQLALEALSNRMKELSALRDSSDSAQTGWTSFRHNSPTLPSCYPYASTAPGLAPRDMALTKVPGLAELERRRASVADLRSAKDRPSSKALSSGLRFSGKTEDDVRAEASKHRHEKFRLNTFV